jgi:hypothetical protein
MKAKILALAGVAGLGVLAQANADEIQFVTLPEVVRTTVVRESNIPDYSRVTRVIRDNQGFMKSRFVALQTTRCYLLTLQAGL